MGLVVNMKGREKQGTGKKESGMGERKGDTKPQNFAAVTRSYSII